MSEAYCKACERDDFANCEAREEEPCYVCGQPVAHACPSYCSGLHNCCYGCAGYPFCSCRTKHTGDCTPETMGKR